MKIQFIIGLIIGILCLQSHGQHPLFYNLNNEKGLPSNEVYDVAQDNKGYLWIGCDEGLFQYDGNRYLPFTANGQNGRSISGLTWSKDDKLYARNFNGQVYQLQHGKLSVFNDQTGEPNPNSLYTIDANNHIWQLVGNQLVEFNQQAQIISKQLLPPDALSGAVIDLCYFNHFIYISDGAGKMMAWDMIGKQHLRLQNYFTPKKTFKYRYFASQNQLYVVAEDPTTQTYSFFQIENNTLAPLSRTIQLPPVRLYNFRLIDENAYISTSNGLYVFRKDNSQEHYLVGENISSVLKDKDGQLWISTLQNGIFIIPNNQIIRFDQSNSKITNSHLTALSLNANELWCGSHDGAVFTLNIKDQSTKVVRTKEKRVSVKSIHHQHHQTWISHGPLSVLNQGHLSQDYPIYNTRDFQIQGDSIVYILPNNFGHAKLSKATTNPYGTMYSTGGRSVEFHPQEKAYFLALNTGLFRLDSISLKEIKDNTNSIQCAKLAYFNGKIYAATFNNGLIVIGGGKPETHYDESNSSLENQLKLVHVDDDGIWCCNRDFIFRKKHDALTWERHGQEIGVIPGDINALTTSATHLYLATNKGLVQIPKYIFNSESIIPFFELTEILVDQKQISFENLNSISYAHQTMTFRFSSVHLSGKRSHTIGYRILELDSTWKYLPSNTYELTFQKLPPQTYTVQFCAISAQGVPSEIQSISFEIEAPLWQTWWFYIIATIGLVGIGFILIRWRYRVLQKKNLNEQRVISSQLNSLKARMNPHFMHNALNSIQSLIMDQENKKANQYLTKFSRLTRMVLDASGKDFISVQEEIDMINWYLDLEKLRFGHDLQVQIDIDPTLDKENTSIPSMIIQPFIENALKHGLLHKKGEKQLLISFKCTEEAIQCTINDNGIGREKAIQIKDRQNNQPSSFATGSIQERFDMLNQMTRKKYKFETTDLRNGNESMGTSVVITLPI